MTYDLTCSDSRKICKATSVLPSGEWQNIVWNALSCNVKESDKVIQDPHLDLDQHQNLITSTTISSSPFAHNYHVWSTSINMFVSYPAHRLLDRQTNSIDRISLPWWSTKTNFSICKTIIQSYRVPHLCVVSGWHICSVISYLLPNTVLVWHTRRGRTDADIKLRDLRGWQFGVVVTRWPGST